MPTSSDREQGGGVLSLDETGKTILLSQEVTGEVPYVEFRKQLEQFCNFAEYWQVMAKEA